MSSERNNITTDLKCPILSKDLLIYYTTMEKVEELEKRIEKIEARNRRVQMDKAWETSLARKILIAFFTYLAIALYLKFIVRIDPWINAIVPTVGFLLSTLTLPFFRKMWEKYLYKNK